jgi:hypothetical protein
VNEQGERGAIEYLKKVGTQILSKFTDVEAQSWVATVDKYPRGILYLENYPEEVNLRIAKFARACRLRQVDQVQIDKVVLSATKPFSGKFGSQATLSKYIVLGVRSCPGMSGKWSFVPKPQPAVKEYLGYSPEEAAVRLKFDLQYLVSVPELYTHPDSQHLFPNADFDSLLNQIREQTPVEDLLTEIHHYDPDPVLGRTRPLVGEIFASQEGGGKLRMYASPFKTLQALLRPIHSWIDIRRSYLETDCTYSQEDGAKWAQSHLLRGTTIHSVDLSAATCRFPLGPQIDALVHLGLSTTYVDLIIMACRGRWSVDPDLVKAGFPTEITWEVGQPLGIAPSMSMFSLTHNLLLRGIAWALERPLDCFRVLGDDVVIADDLVHEEYLRVLGLADIPVSKGKSYSSADYAEFAGFSITKTAMVRAGQWRIADRDNHLSISESIGRPLNFEVPRHWSVLEEFHLWRNGLHDVSDTTRYLRFLKANSNMAQRFSIPSGTPYHEWEWSVCYLALPGFEWQREGEARWAHFWRWVLEPLADSRLTQLLSESIVEVLGFSVSECQSCIRDIPGYFFDQVITEQCYHGHAIKHLCQVLSAAWIRVSGSQERLVLGTVRDRAGSWFAHRESSLWSNAHKGAHFAYARHLELPA